MNSWLSIRKKAQRHGEHSGEVLREFAYALTDRAAVIERGMARLGRWPANRVSIADLFRSLHHIKGDAPE